MVDIIRGEEEVYAGDRSTIGKMVVSIRQYLNIYILFFVVVGIFQRSNVIISSR